MSRVVVPKRFHERHIADQPVFIYLTAELHELVYQVNHGSCTDEQLPFKIALA
jgi:hypothetical protein